MLTTRSANTLLILLALMGMMIMGGEGTKTSFNIDTFQVDSPAIVIVITAAELQSSSNSVTGSSILGGERDLQLTVLTGSSNLIITSSVSNAKWQSSAPNSASGLVTLQYDGLDNSPDLNPSGLFGDAHNDFTANGATAISTSITADIDSSVTVQVYSGSATDYCELIASVAGTGVATEFDFGFDEFDVVGAGCDFSNVGAVVVTVELGSNVDVSFGPLAVVAPGGTASPSPTPSPSAVASRAPNNGGSQSQSSQGNNSNEEALTLGFSSRKGRSQSHSSSASSLLPNGLFCIIFVILLIVF